MTDTLSQAYEALQSLIAEELNKLNPQMRLHVATEQQRGGSVFCMVTTAPFCIGILLASHDVTQPHLELARLYPGEQPKKAAMN